MIVSLVSCAPEGEDHSFDNPYDLAYNDQPETNIISVFSDSKKSGLIEMNPLIISWEGIDSDGIQGYFYKMDDGLWIETVNISESFNNLETGFHTFSVKAKDKVGATDLSPKEITFEVDATPPSVSFTTPFHNASGVDAFNASITATFNEEVDGATIAFTLLDDLKSSVAGSIDYTYNTLTFTPFFELGNGASYIATISSSVSDKVGNSMLSDYSWSFAVYSSDTAPPGVSSTTPARNATNVTVDSAITTTFSEEMTAFTVTTSTFKLQDESGTAVDGALSYSGVTASFQPATSLAYSTNYIFFIYTGVEDLAGNSLLDQYQWSFTTGPMPDLVPPAVSFIDPMHNEIDVAVNSAISATFSEPVDTMTVTTDTFKLFDNIFGPPVAGAVTISGTTAIFTPLTLLNYTTSYTAFISTGVRDLAGNHLASIYEWNFTTGEAPDLTPPAVSLTAPGSDTSGVAINLSVSATFNESLDPLTVSTATFQLEDYSAGTLIDGSVAYNGTTATFSPFSTLVASTWYRAIVKSAIRDIAGNAMSSDYSWCFKTSDTTDFTAPVVFKNIPIENATAVTINSSVVATFNEPMDPSTVTTATFMLRDESLNPVKGTVSYSGLSATFVPFSSLNPWHEYMALVSDLVTDTAGNQMIGDHYWNFSTGDTEDLTPPVATVVSPLDGYASVTKDSSFIISFSEPMDGTSINTQSFTLSDFDGSIAGNVYYDGSDVAIFEPLSTLSIGAHTATLNISAKDLAGNPLLSELSWSFDVVDSTDITAPLVDSHSPLEEEISVDVNSSIFVKFNELMERTSINISTFTLSDGTSNIEGSVFYDGVLTAMFIPSEPLAYSSDYTVNLTSDIIDRAGNSLQWPEPGFAWSFTTGKLPLNISNSIAGGYLHSLAVKSDLSLAAWGYNTNGELGDGTTTPSLTPRPVLDLTEVIAAVAGDNHSMALKNNSTVWVWGDNGLGQLGIGTVDNEIHSIPEQLPGLSDVVSLSAGAFHSMALKSDGTVWTWGFNSSGQLGDGTFEDKASPVQVSDPGDASEFLQGVVAIAAGEYHSVAVKNDNTVWAWGWNNAGQLGNMTTADQFANMTTAGSFVPVSVVGFADVTEVAAGSLHTLALKNDGTVWTWGWNDSGQLGNETYTESLIPVEVVDLSGVSKISSGSSHSMALKNNGTVWTWGNNSSGQLGKGTIGDDTNAPVQVSGLPAAMAIAGGSLHSIALGLDGSVWTWGDNYSGQLGYDTAPDDYSAIPGKVSW